MSRAHPEREIYDIIVIGAGIMGSSTAFSLAKRGKKVLVLEQFHLPHTRGSSHGQTRTIRKAYPQEFYASMMERAMVKWHELEKEIGVELFRNAGLLVVGEVGSPCLEETNATLKKINSPHKRLSHFELSSRYPQFLYPSDYEAVLDKTAGVLWASKCLMAYQTLFKRFGGLLLEGEKVEEIIPGQFSTVVTSHTSYSCKSVVVTAGPWTSNLLKGLGLDLQLKTYRVHLHYWRVAPNENGITMANNSLSERIEDDSGENYIYHGPALEYPGHVKICIHTGPEADPESPDVHSEGPALSRLTTYVRDHFPAVVGDRPSIAEHCIYTMTPDHHFILDYHPVWKNIVIGAGFSGHGFKLAPVVGQVLGELALGEVTSYDLTPFKLSRFPAKKAAL